MNFTRVSFNVKFLFCFSVVFAFVYYTLASKRPFWAFSNLRFISSLRCYNIKHVAEWTEHMLWNKSLVLISCKLRYCGVVIIAVLSNSG